MEASTEASIASVKATGATIEVYHFVLRYLNFGA